MIKPNTNQHHNYGKQFNAFLTAKTSEISGVSFNLTSKPQIFSSALRPFDIVGLNAVLDLVNSETGNEKRLRLNQHSIQLKNLLLGTGIDGERK